MVEVQASGLSCAKALGIARQVAAQVAKSGSVDIPDVSGMALSTTSCTGCGGTKTQVILTFPSGARLTISIRGGKLGGFGGNLTPQPLPTPNAPSPGGSGSGPITV